MHRAAYMLVAAVLLAAPARAATPFVGAAAGAIRPLQRDAAARQGTIDAMRRELESRLAFLHSAHRAFFHAHMSTTAVKARISAAEQRLALLERAERDPAVALPPGPDRAELEAEVAFLERAHRAFFASHRSTTAVKARIAAVEARLRQIGDGGS